MQRRAQSGMIPELMGRLPVIVALDPWTLLLLAGILTRPKDSLIGPYKQLFRADRVSLRFTDGALRAIARKALLLGTGARGLRTVIESVMLEVMYEMPRSRRRRILEVTEDVVEIRIPPVVTYQK